MRRLLAARLRPPAGATFVGYAGPSFTGLLDAHEDVGFLDLGRDSLVFVGEGRKVEVPRREVERVTFRPNAHTWVGLGRWVVVKAGAHTLLLEPRERPTMLGNAMISRRLRREIEAWAGARRERLG